MLLGLLSLLPASLDACSLCTAPITRETLGVELDRAQLAFYGHAVASQRNLDPNAFQGGTTEFEIERVVKDHPVLQGKKRVTVQRYIPVLDPKDPPRYIIFCDVLKDQKLDPYVGRSAKSEAVVAYLEAAKVERAKGRVAALRYYARRLDDPDSTIADDAFLEFAKSKDEDVGKVAATLDPAPLRKMLQNPRLDADRISLFSFLLGSCGDAKDAEFLKARILNARDEDLRALDGLLGGYIVLQPREGWKLTLDTLCDSRQNFARRFAALRTIRFYHGIKPDEAKPYLLQGCRALVPEGEMADLAIEDLRRYKIWDLSSLVFEQHGKPSHDAPIVRRSILRYALACPLPEAAAFLKRVPPRDAELLKDLREALDIEK